MKATAVSQLLRAPKSAGRRNSMRVDDGREGLKSFRDENGGAYRSGEGGEEPD